MDSDLAIMFLFMLWFSMACLQAAAGWAVIGNTDKGTKERRHGWDILLWSPLAPFFLLVTIYLGLRGDFDGGDNDG
jgi:hypothetical protein